MTSHHRPPSSMMRNRIQQRPPPRRRTGRRRSSSGGTSVRRYVGGGRRRGRRRDRGSGRRRRAGIPLVRQGRLAIVERRRRHIRHVAAVHWGGRLPSARGARRASREGAAEFPSDIRRDRHTERERERRVGVVDGLSEFGSGGTEPRRERGTRDTVRRRRRKGGGRETRRKTTANTKTGRRDADISRRA